MESLACVASEASASEQTPVPGSGQAAEEPVWEIEADRATPEEWAGLLDRFEDANIYQSWPYGAVRWGERNLSRLVLRRNGEPVALAQLRIYRPAGLPAGMAYLRWGPLFHRRGGAADAEAAGRMARALRQEYAERRGLFLRILPNAFAGTERARLFQAAFTDGYREEPNQAAAYRTLVLDLASPLEELRRRLDKKWRNQLSQAERKPLRVIAGSSAEEFRRFLPIYAQMRDRKGFDTTVDADEFRRMQEILPAPQRMRVLLCEEQGEAVAGVVASAMGNTAIYLLGATSDRGLSSRGSYLLQWSLIGWLKEQGIRWYDLGGIDPEANPGVYLFKKGLSGRDCAHIASYAACESAVSSSLVQAGEAGRRMLRAWKQRWCAHGEDGGRRR